MFGIIVVVVHFYCDHLQGLGTQPIHPKVLGQNYVNTPLRLLSVSQTKHGRVTVFFKPISDG